MPDGYDSKRGIMTVHMAAELLGVSRGKLYNEWNAGRIELAQIGRTRYVTVEEVLRYLEAEKAVVQRKIDHLEILKAS